MNERGTLVDKNACWSNKLAAFKDYETHTQHDACTHYTPQHHAHTYPLPIKIGNGKFFDLDIVCSQHERSSLFFSLSFFFFLCLPVPYFLFLDGKNVAARTGVAVCSLIGGSISSSLFCKEERENVQRTSFRTGLCLANAKLGSVHGFAGVLGGMLENAPHGGICGFMFSL